MKKILHFTLIFIFAFLGNAQNIWQKKMSDRNENFFTIENDFENYKNSKLLNSKTIPKGLGIKQFERWRYYWQGRVDVNGNFPPEGHVLNEMENYINSHSNFRYASGTVTGNN